jgi:hypothetical protein
MTLWKAIRTSIGLRVKLACFEYSGTATRKHSEIQGVFRLREERTARHVDLVVAVALRINVDVVTHTAVREE